MHEFRIWAPRVKKMQLVLGDETCPMEGPDEQGWWSLKVQKAEPGMDYAFRVDEDATPYPDPKSLWQAKGVHGPSRLYDQSAFAWSDERWDPPPLAAAVIYELHIGTFSEDGALDSAIAHLDHLVELGVTHVELMPVAEWAGRQGWGYDGVALYAVHECYGGPDGFKRFVDACHGKKLAVILDVVYNHFGPVGNYTNKFAPYVTDQHKTPWGDAVNFEGPGSDEVRRFFCDNAAMWMRDYHVDGLRLDAVHTFIDRSAVNFMEQLSAEVEQLSATVGRALVLIVESDLNDPKLVRPLEAGGYGMDAQWSDDFHHALFTLLHPGSLANSGLGYYGDFGTMEYLAKALEHVFVYDGMYSKYRRRSHGRPVEGLSAHHFICFVEDHDQVGNRAKGERLERLVGMDATKVALGLVLTSPYIPMLFMGEEFAASSPFLYFADHDDEEMARQVSEGRKREFAAFGFGENEVLDPEDPQTFEDSKLKWSEVHEGKHAEMLEWTRALIGLRRSTKDLNDGDIRHMKVAFDEEKRWLTMQRGRVRTLMNIGDEMVRLKTWEGEGLRLGSRPEVVMEGAEVVLPGMSLAVMMVEGGDDVGRAG
ncbi:MAG: malto-oligosyltrehalose trehalohydrolase [Acidobacteriaceae bacterium]